MKNKIKTHNAAAGVSCPRVHACSVRRVSTAFSSFIGLQPVAFCEKIPALVLGVGENIACLILYVTALTQLRKICVNDGSCAGLHLYRKTPLLDACTQKWKFLRYLKQYIACHRLPFRTYCGLEASWFDCENTRVLMDVAVPQCIERCYIGSLPSFHIIT